LAKIKVLDKGIVDDQQWYTIICDQQVTRWLYERESEYKYIYTSSVGHIFDIPESTYIMMKIVWSD